MCVSKSSKLPIKESYLMTGLLEKTNEPYAIAKIAELKCVKAIIYNIKKLYFTYAHKYICPGDNYNLQNSHFIPSILRKIYLAKKIKNFINLWGTGKPKEVIHVDDLASAVIHL